MSPVAIRHISISQLLSLWRHSHYDVSRLRRSQPPFSLWRRSHCDDIRYWAGHARRYGRTSRTPCRVSCIKMSYGDVRVKDVGSRGEAATSAWRATVCVPRHHYRPDTDGPRWRRHQRLADVRQHRLRTARRLSTGTPSRCTPPRTCISYYHLLPVTAVIKVKWFSGRCGFSSVGCLENEILLPGGYKYVSARYLGYADFAHLERGRRWRTQHPKTSAAVTQKKLLSI